MIPSKSKFYFVIFFLNILNSAYMQNYKGYIYQNEDNHYMFSIEKRENDTVTIYILRGKSIENNIRDAIEKDSLVKEIYYNLDSLIGNDVKSVVNGTISYINTKQDYLPATGKWLYLDEFQIFENSILLQPISRQKFYFKKGNVFVVDEFFKEETLFTNFKYHKTENVDIMPLHANATFIKEKNEYLIDCKYLMFDEFFLPFLKLMVDSQFHVTGYYYNNEWYTQVVVSHLAPIPIQEE